MLVVKRPSVSEQRRKSADLQAFQRGAIEKVIHEKITKRKATAKEDPFYVADLTDITNKVHHWREKLPRIEPFYAVKCNNDAAVLGLLAEMGMSFDCASEGEIRRILSLGVHPNRIIYAHPCKINSHLAFAAKRHIKLLTFDNQPELHKIQRIHPNAQLLVRIRTIDPKASHCLSSKFGASLTEAKRLLKVAKQLGLNLVGVSFHVGTLCINPAAFTRAIHSAKELFEFAAKELGVEMNVLDIGGGFPGQRSAQVRFDEFCEELKHALDIHFPPELGVRIIAEPGRYFVSSAFTLCANIIAKRVVDEEGGDEDEEKKNRFMYYINDGVFGAYNCLLNDPSLHVDIRVPSFYHPHPPSPDQLHLSSVWGPTCDSIDCVTKKTWLPEMDIGQWLISENMGAYSTTITANFNDFPPASIVYIRTPSPTLLSPTDCHQVGRVDN